MFDDDEKQYRKNTKVVINNEEFNLMYRMRLVLVVARERECPGQVIFIRYIP